MRFGIRPQAALLAAVPLASLLLLLAFSIMLVRQSEEAARSTTRLTDDVALSEQLIQTITRTNAHVEAFVKNKRSSDAAAVDAEGVTMLQQVARLDRAVHDDPTLAAGAAALGHDALRGMDVMGGYVHALRHGDVRRADRIKNAAATHDLGRRIEFENVAFDQAAQAEALQQLGGRRVTARRLEWLLIACSLLAIGLTIGLALLFGFRIVRRLEGLGENARRLAAGKQTFPVQGNDEISELDQLYRAMAKQIQSSTRAHEEVLAELRRERDVTAALQQALLPQIPAMAGARIDTAYMTPAEGAQIGGDWFDVFDLSERLIGLSVGDVTGHGAPAAALMGSVRQALRTIARLTPEPDLVMQYVNRFICDDERGRIVTAFFGVFDRYTGMLTYALAGHGPPLVVRPDGSLSVLSGQGLLLGLDADARFEPHERRLEPGDGLVLYTDGIVEAERDYLQGMLELEAAVRAEFATPSDNMAEGIQRRVFSGSTPQDDSALLVFVVTELAQSDRPGGWGSWQFDARDGDVARRVKQQLLSALYDTGSAAPDLVTTEIVFGELLGNVVRHTPGIARVDLAVANGRVVLTVSDRGELFAIDDVTRTQRSDDQAESGRGLFLIDQLCEAMTIAPVADGKAVSVVLPPALVSDTLARPGR